MKHERYRQRIYIYIYIYIWKQRPPLGQHLSTKHRFRIQEEKTFDLTTIFIISKVLTIVWPILNPTVSSYFCSLTKDPDRFENPWAVRLSIKKKRVFVWFHGVVSSPISFLPIFHPNPAPRSFCFIFL